MRANRCNDVILSVLLIKMFSVLVEIILYIHDSTTRQRWDSVWTLIRTVDPRVPGSNPMCTTIFLPAKGILA